MERISEELRLGSPKKDALGKAYEKLNFQPPSFLLFSVKWKDLDDLYDSISKSLHDLAKSLYEREVSLEERSREVELKEEQLSLKEEGLFRPAEKVEEEDSGQPIEGIPKDVDFKTSQRATSEKQLQKLEGEISKKKDRMISMEYSLDGEVGGEEKELSSAGAGELCSELGLPRQALEAQMATRLDEARAMEENLLSLQSLIEARSMELEDKDGRLQLVQQSLEEHLSKLESKKTEFNRLTESIQVLSSEQRTMMEKRDQCSRDIESREKQYYSLQAVVEARSEILRFQGEGVRATDGGV